MFANNLFCVKCKYKSMLPIPLALNGLAGPTVMFVLLVLCLSTFSSLSNYSYLVS